MRNLLKYIIARTLMTIPMVFILLTIVFVVVRIMPGDPVSTMLGGHAPESVIEKKKHELGLDRPLAVQYVNYLWQICRLDLGDSMVFKQRVIKAVEDKLPATLELTVAGMLIALLIGVFTGAYAADKRRSAQDYLLRFYGIVIYCIPVYWLGLMLQLIFGVWLHVLPIAGRTGPRVFASIFEKTGFYILDTIWIRDWAALGDVLLHLFLPSLTLGLVISGIFLRLTRANMLDVLRSDYVLAAEARGIRHRIVVYKHALKNAFIPILTMMGLQFAQLICNALLTETTFSWPGMGRLLMERIYLRDYPTIQGTIVIYALLVATISLIVDIIYAMVDPRIRY
ncbi:MAG: ABC transporter permease [Deltaproteobacteria bacterium]|nr:ABC transporter permease [Deltaproteobacteria bacterium]MBW1930619.1 ABC transporter permease [Deltaproteobacteria bacterium]MBW2026868.1 ABC transporter permease [Deltaproteobacteria bacterium]MBW2124279.1 ABC transporter permease [Deltaproteobacteria bacterium]RLB23537.1 MAG: ABC transporter permease [Deltaproteobacteria bacterium]